MKLTQGQSADTSVKIRRNYQPNIKLSISRKLIP